MRTLTLPLNGEYFDAIARGEKLEEYRLANDFWSSRIVGRTFDRIVLTRGYPKGGGVEGQTRLTREWLGYQVRWITHPHFGPHSVQVFAIDVSTQDQPS
ncbi:RNA-binding protein [Sphingopyxis bauzanensis]|uniref:RNA-binding protein n=1 Tax=Sphingopyxis bauzanensis TaxID=651663 RepID=A0A246JUF4_9SPHN|nr:RNA-binding protein [Sphingopyxis bauzanensis]